MLTFLQSHTTVFLAFHLLGIAIGLGGATVADMLFFRFLKDFRISKKEAEVMQGISNLVLAALFLIFLSGGALFIANSERYIASSAFQFKTIIVIILTINGICLHSIIAPRMIHISFLAVHPHVTQYAHLLRKVAFAMGAISVTSWYTVFFTATLKSLLPETMHLVDLLLIYFSLVAIAIICSQLVEAHLHRKGILYDG